MDYRRFAKAADAIRFAIEELSPELLIRAHLEVNEERFNCDEIRRLYEHAGIPAAATWPLLPFDERPDPAMMESARFRGSPSSTLNELWSPAAPIKIRENKNAPRWRA
jgi:hypothetical protein